MIYWGRGPPKFSPPQISISASYFPVLINLCLSIENNPPAIIGVLVNVDNVIANTYSQCNYIPDRLNGRLSLCLQFFGESIPLKMEAPIKSLHMSYNK